MLRLICQCRGFILRLHAVVLQCAELHSRSKNSTLVFGCEGFGATKGLPLPLSFVYAKCGRLSWGILEEQVKARCKRSQVDRYMADYSTCSDSLVAATRQATLDIAFRTIALYRNPSGWRHGSVAVSSILDLNLFSGKKPIGSSRFRRWLVSFNINRRLLSAAQKC